MISRRGFVAGTGAASVAAIGGCTTYRTVRTRAASQVPVTLGKVTDIPVGGGKVFVDQRVVVTQPTAGQIKCFTAICTHLGCVVGEVSDGTINCPCHGSEFRITDGSVARGPATQPLGEKRITVTANEVTLG